MITARHAERGARALTEIRRASGNDAVECVPLDLASLASVRACAAQLLDRLDEIHVLDLNAGGMLSHRTETEDGFETQFQANHLGHFLLSQLLLDRLRRAPPPGSSFCRRGATPRPTGVSTSMTCNGWPGRTGVRSSTAPPS